MRVPFDLPERHLVDFEEVVYQLRGYGAHNVADQLYWERTDTEDGWRLTGPWKPTPEGYQRISISSDKYAALREVCGVAKNVFLHRLVSAVMYPTPHGGVGNLSDEPTVHHIDEDKLNCAPANLVIITGGENTNESRPYGLGFCDRAHPIVGINVRSYGRNSQCRYCRNANQRRLDYRIGKTKTYTPLPEFWLWMLEQYSDAPDPELAMMHDTGMLVPVIV